MKELSVTEMVLLCGGSDSQPDLSNIAVGSFNGFNKIIAPTLQMDAATAAGSENQGPVTALSNNLQVGSVISIL